MAAQLKQSATLPVGQCLVLGSFTFTNAPDAFVFKRNAETVWSRAKKTKDTTSPLGFLVALGKVVLATFRWDTAMKRQVPVDVLSVVDDTGQPFALSIVQGTYLALEPWGRLTPVFRPPEQPATSADGQTTMSMEQFLGPGEAIATAPVLRTATKPDTFFQEHFRLVNKKKELLFQWIADSTVVTLWKAALPERKMYLQSLISAADGFPDPAGCVLEIGYGTLTLTGSSGVVWRLRSDYNKQEPQSFARTGDARLDVDQALVPGVTMRWGNTVFGLVDPGRAVLLQGFLPRWQSRNIFPATSLVVSPSLALLREMGDVAVPVQTFARNDTDGSLWVTQGRALLRTPSGDVVWSTEQHV